MAQNFFVNTATVGVDLNNQSTTALFALGTHLLGTQDTEWVYVTTNTSVVGQTMVAINTTYTAGMASAADVINGLQLATAQTSISSQAFGWVALRGLNLTVAATGTSSVVSANICVAGSGVPTGVVSAVFTTSGSLAGIQYLPLTSTGSLATVIMTWPRGAASA